MGSSGDIRICTNSTRDATAPGANATPVQVANVSAYTRGWHKGAATLLRTPLLFYQIHERVDVLLHTVVTVAVHKVNVDIVSRFLVPQVEPLDRVEI
jgi:hypothetical protein